MKGALLQRIFARLLTDSILSDNVIEYTDAPSLTDLPDQGLVTKNMLLSQYSPGGAQVEYDVVAGTTPISQTIPYTDITNPTVLFRLPDGTNYTGYLGYQDTGTDIVLTSPDMGDGTSADTYTVIIKA